MDARSIGARDHAPGGADEGRQAVAVVDCDVHPFPASPEQYQQFLPRRWRYLEDYVVPIPFRTDHINLGIRLDAEGARGPAGSDPVEMDRQLLDEAGVDYAVLVYHTHGNLPDPAADAAQHRALNEWLAAIWLEDGNGHGRYRGSIRVPLHDPVAAVQEIERWGDHPGFSQILALHAYQPAFGHPMYEPVWRAAADRGLPVAVHATTYGSASYQLGTPVGAPGYFFEWHAGAYPLVYAAHLSSLILGGTFERLPDLRFVMLEGGIGWALPLADRLDRYWLRMRQELPEVRRPPSEYLRRNVRFSTQPIEEPDDSGALLDVFARLHADETIMFSTDYPHWDYDAPARALPPRTPADLRARIMNRTACDLYGLPTDRPAGLAAPVR